MQNASLLRRLGAMLYDSLLVLAILFVATVPFIAARDFVAVDPGNLIYQVSMVAVAGAFFVGFWAGPGRTLGMQSWHLQLETADGLRPGIARCCLRFVTAILSLLPLGLGFFWQLVDNDGLSWHDRLSGTRLRHYPKS
jgi:uncharacterized RDD family membrane protein YckC